MKKAMKQMQKMQKDMAKAQEELKKTKVESTAGGGVVRVVVNGQKEVLDITVSEDVVDPDDIEMLQDLILTAANDALQKADKAAEDIMKKAQGGHQLPPGFM